MHCGTPGRTPPRRPAFVGRLIRHVLLCSWRSAFGQVPASAYPCGPPPSTRGPLPATSAKPDAEGVRAACPRPEEAGECGPDLVRVLHGDHRRGAARSDHRWAARGSATPVASAREVRARTRRRRGPDGRRHRPGRRCLGTARLALRRGPRSGRARSRDDAPQPRQARREGRGRPGRGARPGRAGRRPRARPT